jgi:predicted transcriptional regulator
VAGKPQYDLGSAELDILKVLWDRGPSTVREVLMRLHERGRKVAYTTVLTVLTRLEQKGVVASDRSDQAYVYRPRVTRERVTMARLRAMVRDFYDGAAAPMVLQLMKSEKFTPADLANLQKLIDELDADGDRVEG